MSAKAELAELTVKNFQKSGELKANLPSKAVRQEMKEALGDAKQSSDLSWLGKWRETATLAPATSADDEAAYHDHQRPHSSLVDLTPAEFASRCASPLRPVAFATNPSDNSNRIKPS